MNSVLRTGVCVCTVALIVGSETSVQCVKMLVSDEFREM